MILGGLLPSRARFRFAGTIPYIIPNPAHDVPGHPPVSYFVSQVWGAVQNSDH